MHESYKKYLSRLDDAGQYRKLPPSSQVAEKPYVDFSTNDYLNLSRHPEVIQASILAAQQYGVGSTGSRLLSGNHALFERLENKIAHDKDAESTLIFNTGFQTNMSVLSSLLNSKILGASPLVFFDKLNHSSLYQAIFLSKPDLVRYNHNDMSHLSSLLMKYKGDTRPKFIVTETLFGMDGDFLPLSDIVSLSEEHKSFLYLDESHATGIIGPQGYGLSTTVNLNHIPHLVMGTFSKALGCSGGYVSCSQILKDYLINHTPGFIYSTANSPMTIGAVCAAWEMVKDLTKERHHLRDLGTILREKLTQSGFNIGNSSSHIVPIILGKEETTLHAKERLFQSGIIVSCIRPPSVPPGSSRLRIALNISHQTEDIDLLLNILKQI